MDQWNANKSNQIKVDCTTEVILSNNTANNSTGGMQIMQLPLPLTHSTGHF